jgi:quercetin dioxygenase-like cupin family protein
VSAAEGWSGAPAVAIADIRAELPVPQDGTLSRVLYRDERLRIVGFAFAAGQELTEHTAAWPVVLQVLDGRLALRAGDDDLALVPGGWVLLPARQPHALRAEEPTVMLLTMLVDPAGTSDEAAIPE